MMWHALYLLLSLGERASRTVARGFDSLAAKCRRRQTTLVIRAPRIWEFVGGDVMSGYEAHREILEKYPEAFKISRPYGLERWFLGNTPVAELFSDPEHMGCVRLFIKRREGCK